MKLGKHWWQLAFLCAVLGLLALAPPVDVSAAPAIALTPAQGPCSSPLIVTLRGTGFPAGSTPTYVYGVRGRGPFSWGDLPTVGSDGTFVAQLDLRVCESISVPPGSEIGIEVLDGPFRDRNSVTLASVIYAVTASPTPGLPNTGAGGTQARQPQSGGVWLLGMVLVVGAVSGYARRKRQARQATQ